MQYPWVVRGRNAVRVLSTGKPLSGKASRYLVINAAHFSSRTAAVRVVVLLVITSEPKQGGKVVEGIGKKTEKSHPRFLDGGNKAGASTGDGRPIVLPTEVQLSRGRVGAPLSAPGTSLPLPNPPLCLARAVGSSILRCQIDLLQPATTGAVRSGVMTLPLFGVDKRGVLCAIMSETLNAHFDAVFDYFSP